MTSHCPLIIDIAGLRLTPLDMERLHHSLVGGAILFARNWQDRAQLIDLCREIKAVRQDLLIMVDHEGGRVQRFKTDGFTHLPAMRVLGEMWLAAVRGDPQEKDGDSQRHAQEPVGRAQRNDSARAHPQHQGRNDEEQQGSGAQVHRQPRRQRKERQERRERRDVGERGESMEERVHGVEARRRGGEEAKRLGIRGILAS